MSHLLIASLQLADIVIPKLAALLLRGPFHEPLEVVGYRHGRDGPDDAFDDDVGGARGPGGSAGSAWSA